MNANFEKDMADVLKACEPERADYELAKIHKETSHKAIGEAYQRVDKLEKEADSLREQISTDASKGLDISGKVSARAKLLAEIAVLQDAAHDLETSGIVAADEALKKAQKAWQHAFGVKMKALTVKYQTQVNEKFLEIAHFLKAFQKSYNELCERDPEVNSNPYRYNIFWVKDEIQINPETGRPFGWD